MRSNDAEFIDFLLDCTKKKGDMLRASFGHSLPSYLLVHLQYPPLQGALRGENILVYVAGVTCMSQGII